MSCRVGFLAGLFLMLVSIATVAGRCFAEKLVHRKFTPKKWVLRQIDIEHKKKTYSKQCIVTVNYQLFCCFLH